MELMIFICFEYIFAKMKSICGLANFCSITQCGKILDLISVHGIDCDAHFI